MSRDDLERLVAETFDAAGVLDSGALWCGHGERRRCRPVLAMMLGGGSPGRAARAFPSLRHDDAERRGPGGRQPSGGRSIR